MKGFSARRGINPILMLRSPLHVGRLTRHIRRPYLCNGLQADAKAKHNPPNIVKGTGSIDAKLKVYKSQLYTIPNMITISRMCCSPLLTLAIINDEKMIALGGCCVAAFSDWLDGYIAKNFKGQMTVLGGMLDPIADKFMIGALTVGLSYKALIPFELATVIIGRDFLLLGATFALRKIEQPPGTPYFDTTYSATFEIIPSLLSKINTGAQFLLLACTLSKFAFAYPTTIALEPLWWITGTTTVGSFVGYLDGSAIKRLAKSGEVRGRAATAEEEKNEEDK